LLKYEIEKSRPFIKKYRMRGFRAPRMRISEYDMKILSSEGFLYDSSTYDSFSSRFAISKVREVPVSTYPVNNNHIFPRTFKNSISSFEFPFGSGIFMGALNYRTISKLISKVNEKNKPTVIFIHPWQLTGAPLLFRDGLIKNIVRIPYFIKISKEKIKCILKDHVFTTVETLLKETISDDYLACN
jgi:hypothetical protein